MLRRDRVWGSHYRCELQEFRRMSPDGKALAKTYLKSCKGKQEKNKHEKYKKKSIFNWIFVCSFLYMPDIYTYSLADIFYWNDKLAAHIAASLQSEPSFKIQPVILVANSSKFTHLFRFIIPTKEKICVLHPYLYLPSFLFFFLPFPYIYFLILWTIFNML